MAQAKLLGIEGGNNATSEPQPISVTIQTVDARKYDSVEWPQAIATDDSDQVQSVLSSSNLAV